MPTIYPQVATPTIEAESGTAEELALLSVKLFEAINAQDWEHAVFQHLHENFVSRNDVDDRETVNTRAEFIDTYRTMAENSPEFHINVVRVDPMLNKMESSADVWVCTRMFGLGKEGKLQRETMSRFSWRKSHEVWTCCKQLMLSGIAGIT